VLTATGLGHIIGSEPHNTWYNFKHGTIDSDSQRPFGRYSSTSI
jgi:hypothetical protein